MRVVVVSPTGTDCVASRCLRAEQLTVESRSVRGEHGYAHLLAELWKDGETFALVEDDIAPWPGAVLEMLQCQEPWCGFGYCLPSRWEPADRIGTLGCFKVDGSVMHAHPKLWCRWHQHVWDQLDTAFVVAMREVLGLDRMPFPETMFHRHRPDVAHARGFRPLPL